MSGSGICTHAGHPIDKYFFFQEWDCDANCWKSYIVSTLRVWVDICISFWPIMEIQTCGKPIDLLLEKVLCMNILSSDYFKELYRLKTYHEVIDEIFNQVDHVEPWMAGTVVVLQRHPVFFTSFSLWNSLSNKCMGSWSTRILLTLEQ